MARDLATKTSFQIWKLGSARRPLRAALEAAFRLTGAIRLTGVSGVQSRSGQVWSGQVRQVSGHFGLG